MVKYEIIEQGGDAYRAWSDDNCRGEMPENPYPEGTDSHGDWECGFDSAMNWRLYDQYTVD